MNFASSTRFIPTSSNSRFDSYRNEIGERSNNVRWNRIGKGGKDRERNFSKILLPIIREDRSSSLAEKHGRACAECCLISGGWRDTASSKETKIVLRPGYKLQISLPSPANARLLVYPACRGCLRFFFSALPLFTPFPIQFRVACSVPSQSNFRKVRLANDSTSSPPPMEIAGNFIGNGFFFASYRTFNSKGHDKRPLYSISISSTPLSLP